MKKVNSRVFLFVLLLALSGTSFANGNGSGSEADSGVEIVSATDGVANDDSRPRLFAARAFLLPGDEVIAGYARHTYLLLAHAADDESGDLNRELLDGYLFLDDVSVYESGGASRDQINVVYIPLREAPGAGYPDLESLFEHYDFERAQLIRQAIGNLDIGVSYAVGSNMLLAEGEPVDADHLEVVNLSEGAWSLIEFVGADVGMPMAANGGSRGSERLTGRAFLPAREKEESDYGLYSYLLFAEQSNAVSLPLYLAVLDAYLKVIDVGRFEEDENISRAELNVFYLPLREAAPEEASIEWLLERYDFARAKIVLRAIGDGDRGGPYIVSYAEPLRATTQVDSDRLLVQDLSAVPADLAFLWVREFMSQASEPQYWDTRALHRFMLSLRMSISVVARAFTEVQSAHADVASFMEDRIKIPE